MKVALVCESLLLKKSLEIYLKEYICDYKSCDFVITDRAVKSKKPVLRIGKGLDATLRVPFTKEQALSKAQRFYHYHLSDEGDEDQENEQMLEKVLTQLNKKHKEKIEKIIREFHAQR
jgi:hypothetical protein